MDPRPRRVNGRTVDAEPLSDLCQSLLEYGTDDAVGRRSDVEQQIAAAADGLRQHSDQLAGRQVVGESGVAPVAPRHFVDGVAVLPLVRLQSARIEFVGARVEIAVMTGGAGAPPVVDHHLVSDGRIVVEPRQKIGGIPVRVRRFPVAVRPDNARLVFIHLNGKRRRRFKNK